MGVTEELTELKILNEDSDSSKYEQLIFDNNTTEMAALFEKNPKILLDRPKLIKRARTSEMVEILLQFEKLQALNEKRIKDVDSEEYEVRETILKAIRKTFETVLKRWPSIAVEVLNKHLKFSGYCAEDPELEAEIDFSLVYGTDDSKGCIAKPEHLIHLSELNVNYDITREILLHPVVAAYLHLKTGADWGTFFLKMILLLWGMTATIIDVFDVHFDQFCKGIQLTEDASERELFLARLMVFVYIFFAIHTVTEIFKVMVLRKFYLVEGIFQAYVCVSFYLVLRERGTTHFLCHINFLLVLSFNVLVSLASGNLTGKYILLSWGVLKTMLKVMSPILFLMAALAASEFALRYDEVLAPYFDETKTETGTLNQTEICDTIAPFTGDLGRAERSFFMKSCFHIVNVMYGQSDTSDITHDYSDLMTQESYVDLSYAVHWIVSTILTTIILMNLFIGITLGDVGEIEKSADCQIIQIQLKKLYLSSVLVSCCKIVLGLCRKKKNADDSLNDPEGRILVMRPNKFKKGNAVVGKSGLWYRIGAIYSANYVLGCANVRRLVLKHFE